MHNFDDILGQQNSNESQGIQKGMIGLHIYGWIQDWVYWIVGGFRWLWNGMYWIESIDESAGRKGEPS